MVEGCFYSMTHTASRLQCTTLYGLLLLSFVRKAHSWSCMIIRTYVVGNLSYCFWTLANYQILLNVRSKTDKISCDKTKFEGNQHFEADRYFAQIL